MPEVTVIIPVAPYHTELLSRAVDSVEAQTVPCQIFYTLDEKREGPGVLRNRMFKQVKTPLVVFLDADDWIEPTFVETCMRHIQPSQYVYTEWFIERFIEQSMETMFHEAPEKAWCGGTWHPITTLLWAFDVLRVGGFDETLSAHEDTDFYLRLVTHRICGIRVQKPLFHYSNEGQRAIQSRESGRELKIHALLEEKYGGKMGCCGDNKEMVKQYPLGVKQPGDVLAQAQWGGNRAEYGRGTGRHYIRMSYPKMTWVHPRDIEARPDHWEQVIEPAVDDPYRFDGAAQFASAIAGGREKPQPLEVTHEVIAELNGFSREDCEPDFGYVLEVAKKKLAR